MKTIKDHMEIIRKAMKINATSDPGFEKQTFRGRSWWAPGSRWQRMRSCVLKSRNPKCLDCVWRRMKQDCLYVFERLFRLLLTYSLALKRHDCWAWLHGHDVPTHNARAAWNTRWFSIHSRQPRSAEKVRVFFFLSFSSSFFCIQAVMWF